MAVDFESYLTSAGLDAEAVRRVRDAAQPRLLARGEAVLREGSVCRHKVFVLEGLLRTVRTADDGSEHILQFATEGGWTLDPESYDLQVPSLVSIEAVEKSSVLLWPKPDFDRLLAEVPRFRGLADAIIARNIYHNRKRMLSALSDTPEARYEAFVNEHPELLARLPLRMIAAYLGMSLKTLTRVRQARYQG